MWRFLSALAVLGFFFSATAPRYSYGLHEQSTPFVVKLSCAEKQLVERTLRSEGFEKTYSGTDDYNDEFSVWENGQGEFYTMTEFASNGVLCSIISGKNFRRVKGEKGV